MFAFVFGLLRALIQNVLSFVETARMARTGVDRQAGDAGGFGSAILTVVVHSLMLVGWIASV